MPYIGRSGDLYDLKQHNLSEIKNIISYMDNYNSDHENKINFNQATYKFLYKQHNYSVDNF